MPRDKAPDDKRLAAGLLLRLGAASAGLSRADVATNLGVTPSTISRYESNGPPQETSRQELLTIARGFHLSPRLTNVFLRCLDEAPEPVRARGRPKEGPGDLLFEYWTDRIPDQQLPDVRLALDTLVAVARRRGNWPALDALATALKPDLQTIPADSQQSDAVTTSDMVESILADIPDARIADLERDVRHYIASGEHGERGPALLDRLSRELRSSPSRFRSTLNALLGWLQQYEQDYTRAADDLAAAVAEMRSQSAEAIQRQADTQYREAMVYLDQGDAASFRRARSLFNDADRLYERLESEILPDELQLIATARKDIEFQRARMLTWGFERGLGERFELAEEIYARLLSSEETDDALTAAILKERGDNLRLQAEARGNRMPAAARGYFRRAADLYEHVRDVTPSQLAERRCECSLNLGYVFGLLGDPARSRKELMAASRLAIRSGLRRQALQAELHLAQAPSTTPTERLRRARVALAIARAMGSKRGENVATRLITETRRHVPGGLASVEKAVQRDKAFRTFVPGAHG